MTQLLLKVNDAAKALSLSRSKTYELIHSGELPSIRIGKAVRVPSDALEAWIKQRMESGKGL